MSDAVIAPAGGAALRREGGALRAQAKRRPRAEAGAKSQAGADIAYFVHDASHADIARRVEMFARGAGRVRVLGFRRGEAPDKALAAPFTDLGRTQDRRLLGRMLSVAKALLTLPRWERAVDGAEVVVARNLETLILASAARSRRAPRARLIYECLDIHRLQSGAGLASRLVRFIERRLLRRVDAVMVSSPGFVREHFARQAQALETILVENKVGVSESIPERQADPIPAGPPWRIGWFGVIRCRRSLDILIETARANPGLIEVVIAGRPSTSVIGDLDEVIPKGIGVTYAGPFADEADLARRFRSVHFAWLMDFYEAGANSDWLLPNRLYRAAYYGAVPIALTGVETGRWLQAHEAGLLMDEVTPERLAGLLKGLSAEAYGRAKRAVEAIPTSDLVSDAEECARLVSRLRGATA